MLTSNILLGCISLGTLLTGLYGTLTWRGIRTNQSLMSDQLSHAMFITGLIAIGCGGAGLLINAWLVS